jgi:glyoxylase-like metal-dependent hydrolase (beta-lactamase superfamily II)
MSNELNDSSEQVGEKIGEQVSTFSDLGHGITCIDADYVKPGMACFYLVESEGEYAVIETGTNHSVKNLTELLNLRQVSFDQVRYIIPTHVHLDHAGGAGAMMALFERAQLLVHPRGARHMADPSRLVEASKAVYGEKVFAQLYGEVIPVPQERILEMSDGDSVQFGSRAFTFRHTEGHARHHFCVWDETSRGWFTGDMFGLCYPWFRLDEGEYLLPSTTPTQFDPEAYKLSLEILGSTVPDNMYLTHYGCVNYSAEKAALLASQLEAYCRLALSSNGGDLEASLTQYALEAIKGFAPSVDEGQARNWLQFDMQLNAQGVEHWVLNKDRQR